MNTPFTGHHFKLGLLGGGQLGRMLIQEAIDLDLHVHVLDPTPDAPCAAIANSFTVGDFRDYDTVLAFGSDKDLITIEIEDVNVEALRELRKQGVRVCPDPDHIATIKDKGLQKQFFVSHGIATSPFELIEGRHALTAENVPCVLKLRTGGYDGKGVKVIRTAEALSDAFDAPCVVEPLVDIAKELSVIVARNADGQTAAFPVVELVFDPEANLVDFLFAPAQIEEQIERRAHELATSVVNAFGFTGILAVEMFLTTDGHLLVNEVAPRTHNSGHHTIEANLTSQFMQHLRAILNLPLGSTKARCAAAMVNIVGAPGEVGLAHYDGLERILQWPGVYPHFYGKASTKPHRKMGHVTALSDEVSELRIRVAEIKAMLKVVAKSN